MEITNTVVSQLAHGEAPENKELVRELSVGIDFVTDFWREKYLKEYINKGGSKIKFVTGRNGSGKTHFLELFTLIAQEENYITAGFSAKQVWIHDFKEIYLEVLRQCNLMEILRRCSFHIIEELGFSPTEIPEGLTFIDYLSENDLVDGITRREIRLQLKKMFLENPLIDNNFALACSLLTGGILGHPVLEEPNRDILLCWLEGDKAVKLASLRALGLSPSRITKFNARHMLRSLSEIVRLAGFSGLLISIDNLEILLSRSSLELLHYTKLKREDAYESIRQLIDDIDSLKNIMFVFAFDKELLTDERAGIMSYQALWMRIQNEIIGDRFNRFTDIVDLDKVAEQEYTPSILVEMSKRLVELVQRFESRAEVLDEKKAEELIEKSKVGSISLPLLVNRATFGGGASE